MEDLPFSETDHFGARARIGLIVLSSDWTIEGEFREVLARLGPEVGLYTARIANDTQISPESLAAMGPRLTGTADTLLPEGTLDVIGYGCTSASMVLGEDVVVDAIRAVKPNVEVTTPITAAFRAFGALGLRRIAVLTPYARSVNEVVLRYIENRGFELPVFVSFNEPNDRIVGRIDAESLRKAVSQMLADHDVDGVFVSCTSLRVMNLIDELERDLGLPITSSNHALIWDCLRRAKIDDQFDDLGKLYTA
ncbi:MAG: aspartate/glutamate racemase family protein [Pseudomonadota bacterium]